MWVVVWQASIYFPTVLQNLGMYNMDFSDKAAKDHFKTTGKLHRLLHAFNSNRREASNLHSFTHLVS